MAYEFHENLVIWKDQEDTEHTWNGFGFLGESRHGKTPLSFAFAYRLFENDKPEMKILDDCFTLEDGRVRQCRSWGNRDHLAQGYYTELAEAMKASSRSITEVEPKHASYPLGHVTAYLLLLADGSVRFKKERCHRQEFVEKLMSTNPFTWDYPKPGKEVVLQRFQERWKYFTVLRQKETTGELIDLLANEAFADSRL